MQTILFTGHILFSSLWDRAIIFGEKGKNPPAAFQLFHAGAGRGSILTRPEGRVLHSGRCKGRLCQGFQSSPDPKAGCYIITDLAVKCISAFQSSPDPKAGCYEIAGRI